MALCTAQIMRQIILPPFQGGNVFEYLPFLPMFHPMIILCATYLISLSLARLPASAGRGCGECDLWNSGDLSVYLGALQMCQTDELGRQTGPT